MSLVYCLCAGPQSVGSLANDRSKKGRQAPAPRVEGIVMWICRHCAAHVPDDVLHCPSCDTPAPARLQPELAENVSPDPPPAPPPEEPRWLTWRGLPVLEKQSVRRLVEIAA